MFIWTGSAGNGKGTLDTALQTVLGKYYASVDMSQLTAYDKEKDRANSQLASTQFARCVMATEPETSYGSDTLKSSTIKKWTGNDKIRARFLRGQSFEFIPKFTLYIQTNDTPNLSKRDNGTDRRINVMKFPFVFDAEREVSEDDHAQGHRVKDITMKSKLETDERYRYGLLHLMVNQWLETNGKYYVSQKVKEATKEYMNKNNELNEWGRLNLFALCVDIPKKKWAKAEDLFDKYKSENPTSNIRNQTDFTKLLKELNLFKFDINNKKTVFCCEYSPHKVAQQKTKQTSEEEDDE
jgi:phage/plasmid-associated DNA primase